MYIPLPNNMLEIQQEMKQELMKASENLINALTDKFNLVRNPEIN